MLPYDHAANFTSSSCRMAMLLTLSCSCCHAANQFMLLYGHAANFTSSSCRTTMLLTSPHSCCPAAMLLTYRAEYCFFFFFFYSYQNLYLFIYFIYLFIYVFNNIIKWHDINTRTFLFHSGDLETISNKNTECN